MSLPTTNRNPLHNLSRRLSCPTRQAMPTRPHNKSLHTRPERRQSSSSTHSSPNLASSNGSSSVDSLLWSENSSDSDSPSTPVTDTRSEVAVDLSNTAEVDLTRSKNQHASTTLVTQDPSLLKAVVSDGESGTQLIQKYCCGGGCCFLNAPPPVPAGSVYTPLDLPDNVAFRALSLKLANLNQDTDLSQIVEYPQTSVSFTSAPRTQSPPQTSTTTHPPTFVQPHPPYSVFSAPVYHARELTKPGAEKRTFHFDIDVTDYPEEEPGVDFKVGGAVGVCPANTQDDVEEIFDLLGVPKFLRDKPITVQTNNTRYPTIWGEEKSRSLTATRRELLTWCSDIQSYPPTKALLRVLAEHASAPNEKKILLYLCSAQGQGAFCDLRTGAHLSLAQLLLAFPSSKPPLHDLLSVLSQLMPRFYSLSNDPHVSSAREGLAGRRLIEIAVSVHEESSWRGRNRTGVGSGFLERMAIRFEEAEKSGAPKPDLRVPLFRGLMANPLSQQFATTDGPMMLIGAGVGMAPFRGFILNRLRNANCASKIWLVQGVRDSQVDELYSGELGKYESEIKKVVQSRAHLKKRARQLSNGLSKANSETDLNAIRRAVKDSGKKERIAETDGEGDSDSPADEKHWDPPQSESRYVQDEVRQQADVVWDVVNAVDGRVFVCGSSKGMGEGVEQALVDVAMAKGGFGEEGAREFWRSMKKVNKYVAEVW